MAVAIGELERDVLEILQKAPGTQGYYTAQKLRTAVQECFDYLATIMFDASYGGWLDDIRYLTTTANQALVSLPEDIAQIKVIRYKIDTVYVPLTYDKEEKSAQTDPSDGSAGNDTLTYRLLGDKLYFNPPLFEGGTDYLMIEGTYYPPRFLSRLEKIGAIWNPAFRNYIKYRTASILVSHKRDFTPPWSRFEAEWAGQVAKLVEKRVNTTTAIKEFAG